MFQTVTLLKMFLFSSIKGTWELSLVWYHRMLARGIHPLCSVKWIQLWGDHCEVPHSPYSLQGYSLEPDQVSDVRICHSDIPRWYPGRPGTGGEDNGDGCPEQIPDPEGCQWGRADAEETGSGATDINQLRERRPEFTTEQADTHIPWGRNGSKLTDQSVNKVKNMV